MCTLYSFDWVGGYTAGPRELTTLLRQRSRPYLFSNALPPPVVACASKVSVGLCDSILGTMYHRCIYQQLHTYIHSQVCLTIYTTKGWDRFNWAATPLKPYKVGNICYMMCRHDVLYFINLSLKHFFPTENGNFCENIQIQRPLSFRVLTRSRMPNRRTSQSKIDCVHCKGISLLNSTTAYSPSTPRKTPQANPTDETHVYNKIKRTTIWFCGGGGSGSLCRVRIFISNLLRATIFIFIQLQNRPFILRYSLFESDGCRIIYLFS